VVPADGGCAECEAVGAFVEACEDCCAAGGTDACCYEGVGEAHSFGGEAVNHGGFQDWVACAAEGVVALVVDQEEYDVGSASGAGRRGCA